MFLSWKWLLIGNWLTWLGRKRLSFVPPPLLSLFSSSPFSPLSVLGSSFLSLFSSPPPFLPSPFLVLPSSLCSAKTLVRAPPGPKPVLVAVVSLRRGAWWLCLLSCHATSNHEWTAIRYEAY